MIHKLTKFNSAVLIIALAAHIIDNRYLNHHDSLFVDLITTDITDFLSVAQIDRVFIFPPVDNRYRFLIHKTVEDFPTLASFSIGVGCSRQTVVCLRASLTKGPKGQEMLMSGPEYQSSSSRGRGRGRVADDSSPFHNRPGATASRAGGTGKVDPAQPMSESASRGATKQGSPRLGGRGRARPRKPEQQLYVPRGRRDQEGQSLSKLQAPDSSRALGQDSKGTQSSDSFKTSGQDSVGTPWQCVLRTSEQDSSIRSQSQRASKPATPASSKSSKKNRADAQIYVPRGRRRLDEENMLEMSSTKISSHLSSYEQISPQNENVDQQVHAVHLEDQNSIVCVDVDETTPQSSANTETTDMGSRSEPGHCADNSVSKSDHHQSSVITDIDSSDITIMASQHIGDMDMKASNQDHFENCAFPVSASIAKSDQYFPCNSETISSFSEEHENENKRVPKTVSTEENVMMSGKCAADTVNLEDEFSPNEVNLVANTCSDSEVLHTVPPSDALLPEADADMEFSSVCAEKATQNSDPSLGGEMSVSDSNTDEYPLLSEWSERQIQENDKERESVLSDDGCLGSSAEASNCLTNESTTRLKGKDKSEMCNNVKGFSPVDEACPDSQQREVEGDVSENSATVCRDMSEDSQKNAHIGMEEGDDRKMPPDSGETASHENPVQTNTDSSVDTVGEAFKSDEEHKDVDHSSQVELSQVGSSSTYASKAVYMEPTRSDSKLTDYGDACSPGEASSTKADDKEDKADDEEEEDEDSWDKFFDDNGDCLDPTAEEELTACVGEVEISRPKKTINYLDYQPKEPSMDMSAYSHVIEISDFPPEFQTRDLMSAFKDYMGRGFDLKWVDDTHAIGVFSSAIAASDALKMAHPMMKLKPLSEGSKQSRSKASRIQEFLQPYKARPVTSAAAARRLVTGALGMTPRITKEQRAEERRVLKEARDKKRQDRKQKEAIWDGDIGKCAMDSC